MQIEIVYFNNKVKAIFNKKMQNYIYIIDRCRVF